VSRDGSPLAHVANLAALNACRDACWALGGDRYGGVTYVKLPAGIASRVQMTDR
jgi:hypothetical protein